MSAGRGVLGRAALVTAVAYGLATAIEFALIGIFKPTEWALTWISDAVLAGMVGVATYLWLDLRATRVALSGAERARVVVDTQLSIAADLQRNLLPQLPADRPGLQWGAHLEPAGRIGGDFYDLVSISGTEVMFILADISGKGIPAAMLLAYTRAAFRTLLREYRQPADLVSRLSSALHSDTGGQPYVTCIVGRLDTGRGTLTYVNAGHPPALLIRDEEVVRLDAGGPPAGLLAEASYVEEILELRAGDHGVFFTDGITEAIERGPGSPADIIVATVRRLPHGASAPAICHALVSLALRGLGPAGVDDWQDDRTVLAFTIGPAGS